MLDVIKQNRLRKRLGVGPYSGAPSVRQKPINGSVFRWGAGPSLDGDSNHPTSSIPQACDTWQITKATYRFFDNDKVTDQAIIAPHLAATQKRLQSQSTVLAIQDTTQLDFTHHPATQGLGILSDLHHQGLFYHPTLLVTPDRVPLGLAHHQVWKRSRKAFGKKHTRKHLPISKKESQKWLNSLDATSQLQEKNPSLHFVRTEERGRPCRTCLTIARLAQKIEKIP